MLDGKADLHMHSTYSDGWLSPKQLVDKAAKAGLSVMSITDHDSVGGIEEAASYAREIGITLIPGIEMSAEVGGMEVHILGYFIDYKSEYLQKYLRHLRELRMDRGGMIVKKLNEMGSRITLGTVLNHAGNDAAIGRPHIAKALNEEGFVGSFSEAFYKYIGDGKPAYVKKPNVSAKEAIEFISGSGGLSFVAHPGKYVTEEIFSELIHYGLDGIEIIHPSHKQEDIRNLSTTASQNFLLTSGGSDFHGGSRNDSKNFGAYYITSEEISNMKRRLI